MKTCARCGLDKPLDDFHRDARKPDGRRSRCKQCGCVDSREWAANHPPSEEQKRNRQDYQQNYAQEHAVDARRRAKVWLGMNRGRRREYLRAKRGEVEFRLRAALRTRLYGALKRGQKSGSAVRDLGCSVEELKGHLAARFASGMTWENWGNGEGKWNIDHVHPLASFDLTDRAQFLQACHYTNLQPMWWRENLDKSDSTSATAPATMAVKE